MVQVLVYFCSFLLSKMNIHTLVDVEDLSEVE